MKHDLWFEKNIHSNKMISILFYIRKANIVLLQRKAAMMEKILRKTLHSKTFLTNPI